MITSFLHVILVVLIYISGFIIAMAIAIPFTFTLYSGGELSDWSNTELQKAREKISKKFIPHFALTSISMAFIFFISNYFYGYLLSATSLFLLILTCLIYIKYIFPLLAFMFSIATTGYVKLTKKFRKASDYKKWEDNFITKTEIKDILPNIFFLTLCMTFTLIVCFIYTYFENSLMLKMLDYLKKIF